MLALFSIHIPKQMVREHFEMIGNIFSVTQLSTLTAAHEKGPPQGPNRLRQPYSDDIKYNMAI
jgi:hypothetical protein